MTGMLLHQFIALMREAIEHNRRHSSLTLTRHLGDKMAGLHCDIIRVLADQSPIEEPLMVADIVSNHCTYSMASRNILEIIR